MCGGETSALLPQWLQKCYEIRFYINGLRHHYEKIQLYQLDKQSPKKQANSGNFQKIRENCDDPKVICKVIHRFGGHVYTCTTPLVVAVRW